MRLGRMGGGVDCWKRQVGGFARGFMMFIADTTPAVSSLLVLRPSKTGTKLGTQNSFFSFIVLGCVAAC